MDNRKLDWVASCAQDAEAKKTYELYKAGIVCQVELEMHYNAVVRRLKKLIAE